MSNLQQSPYRAMTSLLTSSQAQQVDQNGN
jgi:hypothetical protein